MQIGDTFLPGAGSHLWIVISDPAKHNGEFVIANLPNSTERSENAAGCAAETHAACSDLHHPAARRPAHGQSALGEQQGCEENPPAKIGPLIP
jgi:hypothetical protein